ncbi:hypothetical protein [Flavobacterium sp. N1994]|uniref:hypothetical protein n=1 Tax=Flavobacterium sp. N1994 TaxID=2986827 RepID=UPI002221BD01|nr:hypothetical protein [Flavobacterium sp. N1994]
MSIIMQTKPLHIISFDNPFPPDFGGAIDVFYKVKALHAIGFTIHLHCFYEDRDVVSNELKAITEKVYLYKKNKNPFFLFSQYPFPVVCRFRNELIENLAKVDAPIFFEGLHTTMILQKIKLDNKKYLRLHNIESNFYAGMSQNETNYFKKIAYHYAAQKYIDYQKNIANFDHVFTLSTYENDFAKTITDKVSYVPVFHGNEQVAPLSEYGNYAFYHGDLRLADNKNAAKFLIKVFKQIGDYKLIIASSNGKKMVEKRTKNLPNIEFVELKNDSQLDDLFKNAHINVMLSFQKSGTKLKVINSLFKSRFCLVNSNMVDDEQVLKFCELAHSKEEFIAKIKTLRNQPFQDVDNRNQAFSKVLNDINNAKQIAKIIDYDMG